MSASASSSVARNVGVHMDGARFANALVKQMATGPRSHDDPGPDDGDFSHAFHHARRERVGCERTPADWCHVCAVVRRRCRAAGACGWWRSVAGCQLPVACGWSRDAYRQPINPRQPDPATGNNWSRVHLVSRPTPGTRHPPPGTRRRSCYSSRSKNVSTSPSPSTFTPYRRTPNAVAPFRVRFENVPVIVRELPSSKLALAVKFAPSKTIG